MTKINTTSTVASGLLAAIASSSATAGINAGDTLNMTLLSVAPARAVLSTLDGGSTSMNVYGGVLNWDIDGVGGVKTFCVQLNETISLGSTLTYTAVDLEQAPDAPPGPGPMGDARATLIRDLYARNYATVMAATGNDAKNLAAAFAMVVWEITHQESTASTASGVLADLDLTTGNAQFTSGSSANSLAAGMLGDLGGGTNDFLSFAVLGATNPDKQDVLIVVPGPAGLLAIAGLGLVARRRRG